MNTTVDKLKRLFEMNLLPSFCIFSQEALDYAFFEYARFIRHLSNKERLEYLWRKCGEYDWHLIHNLPSVESERGVWRFKEHNLEQLFDECICEQDVWYHTEFSKFVR
jgi:hypothetical protein